MKFAYIVFFISIAIWLFPAIRQYKTNLFYFFLILALEDPAVSIVTLLLDILDPTLVHRIASMLLFYSIDFNLDNIKKNWILNVILVVCFFIGLLVIDNTFFLIIIIHTLILGKFIKYIVIRLHNKSETNLFYLVLIFYELTILVNLIVFLSENNIGYMLHYITLAFQFLIAIFFTVFRVDNPILVRSLRSAV